MMRRLLIANRGEIAIRIAHAARERGIVPLGIYSEADTHALHRRFMDESLCVGPAAAAESYLNVASILTAARELRADAIHPGYGFLSMPASSSSARRRRRSPPSGTRSTHADARVTSGSRSSPDTTGTIDRSNDCAPRPSASDFP